MPTTATKVQNKKFSHWIGTDNEERMHYNNPRHSKSYVNTGQPPPSVTKCNFHGTKLLLCIWYDHEDVIYCKLINRHKTVIEYRYQLHYIGLSCALQDPGKS